MMQGYQLNKSEIRCKMGAQKFSCRPNAAFVSFSTAVQQRYRDSPPSLSPTRDFLTRTNNETIQGDFTGVIVQSYWVSNDCEALSTEVTPDNLQHSEVGLNRHSIRSWQWKKMFCLSQQDTSGKRGVFVQHLPHVLLQLTTEQERRIFY